MADIKEKENNFWTTEKVEKLMVHAEENGIDYKDLDNPFYENDPELRRGNTLWEFTDWELEEIQKCATDVVYFANTYCRVMTDDGIRQINLRDYQVQILNQYQAHRKNIFVSPRQGGKCLLLPAKVITKDNKSVSISSLYTQKNKITILFKKILYYIYETI